MLTLAAFFSISSVATPSTSLPDRVLEQVKEGMREHKRYLQLTPRAEPEVAASWWR